MAKQSEQGAIYIVRHGNTFEKDEPARRIGSATDLPLTTEGEQQARSLGRHFARANVIFSRALCGPLIRTVTTASLILAAQPKAVRLEIADWLAEIDHGPDENIEEDLVLHRLGGHALDRWDTEAIAPADWRVDREARIAAWTAFFERPASGSTLVVTSNGIARFALITLPAVSIPPKLTLRTGAFGRVDRGEDGGIRLTEWDIRPLDAERMPIVRPNS